MMAGLVRLGPGRARSGIAVASRIPTIRSKTNKNYINPTVKFFNS